MRLFLIVIVLLAVCTAGCTIHFKGKDVEFDSVPHASSAYDLDHIDILAKEVKHVN